MSDERVCQLLRSLNLEELIPTFRENAIDDDLIPDLTDQDLAELGLKLGHRKRFLKLAAKGQIPSGSGRVGGWIRGLLRSRNRHKKVGKTSFRLVAKLADLGFAFSEGVLGWA